MTEPTRRLSRAADIELKRRGILSPDDHLCSAEPEEFIYPERDQAAEVWIQPRLDGTVELPRRRAHQPGRARTASVRSSA
jgi:hypothetical protein